jgi:HSP20 family protein
MRSLFAPASIWEDDGQYHVELDLPGVAKEDVEITFDKGILKISAERRQVTEDRKHLHEERGYGRTSRSLNLPDTVDPDSITAEFNDGVLHVTVAKALEAQPKRITIG